MSQVSSDDETKAAVSSVTSDDDDISLPPSPDPYASFLDGDDAPVAKRRRRRSNVPQGPPRLWPTADEVVLLEAVVAHRDQHGGIPSAADLAAALAGRLPFSGEQADRRLDALRKRYLDSVRRLSLGTVPVTDDDMRVYRLSKRLWEGSLADMLAERARRRARREANKAAARHHERRGFAELEALYPCLAAVVEASVSAGALKSAFGLIGDGKAAALEAKARKQRAAELKAMVKRSDLRGEVTRALLEFIE